MGGGLEEDGFGDQRNVSVVGGGLSTSRVSVAGNLCCGSILHRYIFKDTTLKKKSRILHLKLGVLL